jgi:glycosyltransferase involved in cell wall biosynthesis
VTLAHGLPSQEEYSLFESQHQLSEFSSSTLDMLRFVRRGIGWIDEHLDSFDVMHCTSAFISNLLPAAHAQKSGLPTVVFVSIHNTLSPQMRSLKSLLMLRAYKRRLARNVGGLIAMSQSIYDELVSCNIPEERIARIPMGIDAKVFHPPSDNGERKALRSELEWLDLPTVIFVGAIVRRKRPDLLVEAIGLLKKRGVDCQLVLAGPDSDTTYTRQIQDRANELNVSSQIIWFGFTRDIARLFRAADFFSLPSSSEGMAAALIEAMSSGLPPIVTPISGSTDAVEDGVTGRFVRSDPADIADVLSEYISKPRVRVEHGRNSRARVLETYTNERVFEAYERLFRRLMAGGPAAE